jgi:uncharacterized protein (TIGR02466 family)
MKQPLPQNDYQILSLFPTPIYATRRGFVLDPTEEAEIEDIIKGGKNKNKEEYFPTHSFTNNKYIFDTKLADLKEFCEKHIKIYVKEVLGTSQEGLNFYITQSWLNIIEPGESHQPHWHANSIISGVFYVAVEEDDMISFHDIAHHRMKHTILIEPTEYQALNADIFRININNNELLLFPSWLDHGIEPNEKATTDRISLAFNVFVKGNIGDHESVTELIL